VNAGLDIVDHERPRDPDRDVLTIDDKSPMIEGSHGLTEQDAMEVL